MLTLVIQVVVACMNVSKRVSYANFNKVFLGGISFFFFFFLPWSKVKYALRQSNILKKERKKKLIFLEQLQDIMTVNVSLFQHSN